jgi:hypothetical protein
MWAYESVFYQIYPLGFCKAPYENDGVLEHRILKVKNLTLYFFQGNYYVEEIQLMSCFSHIIVMQNIELEEC